eukprot:scaffold207_cov409-Prasinococcus_capsulatus_cf.AAC.44
MYMWTATPRCANYICARRPLGRGAVTAGACEVVQRLAKFTYGMPLQLECLARRCRWAECAAGYASASLGATRVWPRLADFARTSFVAYHDNNTFCDAPMCALQHSQVHVLVAAS